MAEYTRGQRLLIAQRPGAPLDAPPEWLNTQALQAWRDIVAAVPDVLRRSDSSYLDILSCALTDWRAGKLGPEWERLMYRMLGAVFMSMRERRQLLFPNRARRGT